MKAMYHAMPKPAKAGQFGSSSHDCAIDASNGSNNVVLDVCIYTCEYVSLYTTACI